MLFWILLVIAIIGIGWVMLDEWSGAAMILCAVGVLAAVVSIAMFADGHIGVDGYVDAMNTRYEMLTYQYENDIYDNDNDLGKRELMSDIQEWNEDLANYKAIQDDFWIGIYIPNIYDQFEFIKLK
jgi:hypothetical protein